MPFISAPTVLAGDGRVTGERLDPSAIGPSAVETWADVLAREQAAPPAWMGNPKTRNGQQGIWIVPSRRSMATPHSGSKHVINKWGDTQIGIGFSELVDVQGAYFAGQAGRGAWTTGIVVVGYRGHIEVDRTKRFTAIGEEPVWFAMDLCGVDRIVIESEPVLQAGGWYAMDDLTFTHVNDRGQGPIVIDFEDLPYRTKLTGSRFAGLIWEEGTGDFDMEDRQAIHAPMVPPGYEDERADDGPGSPLSDVRDSGTLPDLEMDFEASNMADAGWSFPPDTDGAIGPDHYVQTVNRTLAVYDRRDGSFVSRTSLGAFMLGAQGDPRVVFDQHSGRWIVIVSGFDTNAKIFLAVSTTSNPTGSWFKTSFETDVDSDAGTWPDYPTLGVDVNGIYTSTLQAGRGTHTIFAIDKAPLVSHPQSLGTITAFRGLPWDGAIQPAHTYGNPGGEYLVSRYSSGSLRIRRIDPPLTSPTLVDVGFVAVPTGSEPPNAPALGSSTDLHAGGSRLMMSVYRDGSLWTCNAVSVSGRAGVHWYEIDPAATSLIQSGEVADSTLHYFYPSIMVNRDGNVALGFSGSHAGQYAAAYYTGRSASDPPGEMAPPALLKAGEASYSHIDGYGRNRWGDYSYTTLDPVDERKFWTIQEYAESGNRWGTWVGVLRANDCNANGVPDSEDISGGTSLDSNGNGVPDECEVEPPSSTGGDYMNRFIHLSPENEGITTGLQVSLTSGPGDPGVVGWVGEPFDPGCPDNCLGKYFARVVDEPVYRIWTEESVYVGDCEIVPVAQYEVRASGNDAIFSEPATFSTIPQPAPHWWADVVGTKFAGVLWEAPNGVVNFMDVTAAIECFISHPTGPVLEWVDIEPQEPNFVVNFSDIMQIVLAFQGESYPFVAPADCP